MQKPLRPDLVFACLRWRYRIIDSKGYKGEYFIQPTGLFFKVTITLVQIDK